MKKIFSLILCIAIAITLCGCDIASMFEDFSAKEVFAQFSTLEEDVIEEEIIEEYYEYSPEFDSCYNSLNKKQKKLYNKIYSATEVMPEGFVKLCEQYDGVIADVNIAYRAVLNDNCEIFWMPDTYLLGKKYKGDKVNICISFCYSNDEQQIDYVVNKEKRDTMRAELDKKAQEIITASSMFNEDFEIVKFLNDYICANTEYNKEAEFCDTAYGCIVKNQALCEGYARAFKLLCNLANVECDLIQGKADGVGHIWNTVNINGMYSYVDVTWNDQKEKSYAYLNITEKQLIADHKIAPLFEELSDDEISDGKIFNFIKRDCNSPENSYYVRSGCAFTAENEKKYAEFAAEKIREKAGQEVYSVGFLLGSENIIKDYEKDNEEFIIKIQQELDDIFINGYSYERDVLTLFYEVSD